MTIAYNLKDILTLDEACAEIAERFNQSFTQEDLKKYVAQGDIRASWQTDFMATAMIGRNEYEQVPIGLYDVREINPVYKPRIIFNGQEVTVYEGQYAINDDGEWQCYVLPNPDADESRYVVTKENLDAFIAKAQGSKVAFEGASDVGESVRVPSFKNIAERNSWIVLMKAAKVRGDEIIRLWNRANPANKINKNTVKNARVKQDNINVQPTSKTQSYNSVVIIDGKRKS